MNRKLQQLLLKRAKLQDKISLLQKKKMQYQQNFFNSSTTREEYFWSIRLEAVQTILKELDDEYDQLENTFIKATRELEA